jgi:hypothetical protein
MRLFLRLAVVVKGLLKKRSQRQVEVFIAVFG